jgi:hypothetical protein
VNFPEKFHAYFAVSQIPHWTECEKDAYKWLLEEAKRKNKKKAILELEGNGIPPYQNMKEWESFRKWLFILGGYSYKTKTVKPPTMMGFMKNLLSSPDYTMKDVLSALANGRKLIYTERMIRDLVTINFFDIKKVQVPIYFFHGMHDNTISAEQAKTTL